MLNIQTLKSCAKVTVNGKGNSFISSLTITLPAADTPEIFEQHQWHSTGQRTENRSLTVPYHAQENNLAGLEDQRISSDDHLGRV
jgi:hypothetical protein